VCSDIVCYSVLMVRSNRPPLHTCTDSLCRNVKKGTAVFAPISVSPLLSPNTVITGVSVRPNGVPVVQLSSGTAFTYDAALCTFVQLADKWYIGGSDAWQGRQRGGAANKGVLGALELAISEGVPAAAVVGRRAHARAPRREDARGAPAREPRRVQAGAACVRTAPGGRGLPGEG
jgi:hypothetical protein